VAVKMLRKAKNQIRTRNGTNVYYFISLRTMQLFSANRDCGWCAFLHKSYFLSLFRPYGAAKQLDSTRLKTRTN